MGSVKTILLSKSIYEDTDKEANELRAYLKEKGVFLVNIMSSPGAGKTTTLISLIKRLSAHFRIGVMEADIDSDVDAIKIADKAGCKSVQLHTGGMCHLDAAM
ncbi:MAG: hydrogenase accessory protein HypB, partial [Clostridia bacterium]|nr:hydrogenase accessory protein HypB [Clostridia bacterium]